MFSHIFSYSLLIFSFIASQAYAQSVPVYSQLQSVETLEDGTAKVSGWACRGNSITALWIEIYAGERPLGQRLEDGPANIELSTEISEATPCNGSAHGFEFLIPEQDAQEHLGQNIHAYAIYAGELTELEGSGSQLLTEYTPPVPVVPVKSLVSSLEVFNNGSAKVSGWACRGNSTSPMWIEVYAGERALGQRLEDGVAGNEITDPIDCNGTHHGFEFSISAEDVQQHIDEPLHVYAIYSTELTELEGSGQFILEEKPLVEPIPQDAIVVASSQELLTAVVEAQGGETIALSPGTYTLSKYILQPSSSIRVTSLDSGNRATIAMLHLNGVDNLHFDNLVFYAERSQIDRTTQITLLESSNISIKHSHIYSNGTEFIEVENSPKLGTQGINISKSSHIEVSDNLIHNCSKAISNTKSDNIVIKNNEIYGIQGDNISLTEVVDVLIEDNYLHDFVGTHYDLVHMDFIQMWSSTRSEYPSENLIIRGNIFDSGGGLGSQTIFLRNELVFSGKAGEDFFYRNFIIEDNLIYNGHKHGISIGEINGAIVRNNTLIKNVQSPVLTRTGLQLSPPTINFMGPAKNVSVTNNLTKSVNTVSEDVEIEGNIFIDYDNVDSENYVGNLFVNAVDGGKVDLSDLQAAPGSIIYGETHLGSPFTHGEFSLPTSVGF